MITNSQIQANLVPAEYQDRLTPKYLVAFRPAPQTQGKELSLPWSAQI